MEEKISDIHTDSPVSDVFHCYQEVKNDNWKTWEANQCDAYREYRRLWKEVPEQLQILDRPLHLDIEVTSRCNLLCPFCARTQRVNDGTWRKSGDIDIEIFKSIVDQMVKDGIYAMNLNYLGEPLIHKQLCEMIRYAKSNGILDVFFHTNGVLLTEKRSRELIATGLDKLVISFDSPYKEKYEAVRINAKYDHVLKNVINFNRIRTEIGSITPVTRINFIKLPGVTQTEIDALFELFTPHVDAIGLLDYIEGDNSKRNVPDYPSDYNSKFVCSQLLTRMLVLDDGTVTPCCSDYDTEEPLGNLKDSTIKEIWLSERRTNMVKKHLEGKFHHIPVCRRCDYAIQADRISK